MDIYKRSSQFKFLSNLILLPILIILVGALSLMQCQIREDDHVYKIGFSQCTSGDQWRQAMHEEMYRELAFHPELTLEIKDAKDNNQLQINHIEEFIDQGVDLLIVSPNEAAPITPAVEKAFQMGIPVIIIDRRTSSSMYSSYVGADNYDIGKIAGNYAGGLVKPGDKIIEIWGLEGSTPAVNRHEGFIGQIDKESVQVIHVKSDWTKETAKEKLEEIIANHLDVDVVYAHNDVMALGAYEVCRTHNIHEKVKFLGVDGLPGPNGGMQYVLDGILQATFLYPTGGEEAIRIASDILHRRPYQKENILATTVIDPTNVRILKLQTDRILNQQQDIRRQQEKIDLQLEVYQSQRAILYLVVISLVISILLGAYALYSLKEKQEANRNLAFMNEQISRQKKELEAMALKAEEATQAKFKFFTNISHEFRTPLTLIIGAIEEMVDNNKRGRISNDLEMIDRNAHRLLRLINQLMDFRKIENNKMKLNVSQNDIVAFIKDIKTSFEKLAASKKINFKLIAKESQVPLWFDTGMMDKVMFNLLSNAFKFTPERGFIHIYLSTNIDGAKILVRDNGVGMNRENLDLVFSRFYQGDHTGFPGSGLGLALSKEIIGLHGGEIDVESEKGKGTTFTIHLKFGNAHFDGAEIIDGEDNPREDAMLYLADFKEVDAETDMDLHLEDKEYTMLIIEDSADLQDFLQKKFSDDFQVKVSGNGEEGLKTAIEEVPDIIVCDIMLPGKDGLAIASNLKTDLRTSHIPIILLTAKVLDEYQLEGIMTGADMYITKPFSFRFLAESVKTLLKNRARLKDHYLAETPDEQEHNKVKDVNKQFIEQFKSIILRNLRNSDFNVNDVCKEIGLSRVQLYRKVKAIIGMSVHDYLAELRLRQAQKLLTETELTISEIAYESGFSSPGYFSTAFKNKYGISPSDFKITQ